MPREDRRILFSNEEVYKAIFALSMQKQLKKPPPGQVLRIYEDPREADTVIVELENPQDMTHAKVEYSRDFIAASLMLYCRGCGIPLPKNAKKSVMLGTDDMVILRVQIG